LITCWFLSEGPFKTPTISFGCISIYQSVAQEKMSLVRLISSLVRTSPRFKPPFHLFPSQCLALLFHSSR
jgi:hypothetical protein